MRAVQESLSSAREDKARSEARLEGARERRSALSRLIREQVDCAPEECLSRANQPEGAELPTLEEVEPRLAKLKADRERLGGVNLRAEEEEIELAAQLEDMEREQGDVEEAIAQLRQGISGLNREGRKRLLEAFQTVNAHFSRLFQTLFGGGTAELRLVDSDDPLESGLEIFAQPPGKKTQTLSLMSGGEKALTALALIFAVFLTNPSAHLCAGRGGCPAGRRQCGSVLPTDGGNVEGNPDSIPHYHPPSAHHGPCEPSIRCDDAGAWR